MSTLQHRPIPDVVTLMERFHYSEGNLIWKARPRREFASNRAWAAWNSRFVGRPAGSPMSNGYLMVAMGGTKLLLHRLVYAWHGGELTPDDVVDHIDGNPANNRIQNLRACSRAENQWNRRTKTSLPKGVHWSKREQRYKVSIRAKPATHFIGTYKTLDEASAAAAEAKAKYHGEFSRG